MTNTRERWIKVGTALSMVPGGVPSEKTEKFAIFLNFLKMSFFRFLPIFHQKYITLGHFWEG